MGLYLEADDLAAFRKGDEKAFNKAYAQMAESISTFCWNWIRDRQAAEDMVSNIFVKIWIHRSTINDNQHLKRLLFTIARQHIANWWHNKQRRDEVFVPDIDIIDEAVDLEDIILWQDIEEEVTESFVYWAGQAFQVRLPKKCQVIFNLKHQEGMGTIEISKFLKISPQAVSTQLGIAYKKIRKELIKKGYNFTFFILWLYFLFF